MAKKDDLLSLISPYRKVWARNMRLYGSLSAAMRVFIIIGSSTIAAKEAFKEPFQNLHVTSTTVLHTAPFIVPVLSLLVAICAAIESWLKPRDKWKGFMDVGQQAEDVFIDMTNAPDDAAVAALEQQFRQIKTKHMKENVF